MVHKNCSTFLVLLFLLNSLPVLTQNLTYAFDSHNIADVTLFMICQYLTFYTPMLMISEKSTIPQTSDVNTNLLNHIIQNLNESMTMQLGVIDKIYKYTLLIVDSFEAIQYDLSIHSFLIIK